MTTTKSSAEIMALVDRAISDSVASAQGAEPEYGAQSYGALLAAVEAQAEALRVAQAEVERLKPLSVENIMLEVVPGDGSGFEVYAKTVADVEAKMYGMGSELEEYQLGIKVYPYYKERITALQSKLDALAGQEPVAVLNATRADGADKYAFGFGSFGPPPYGIHNLYLAAGAQPPQAIETAGNEHGAVEKGFDPPEDSKDWSKTIFTAEPKSWKGGLS